MSHLSLKLPSKTRYWRKVRWKWREDGEEDVSSYWMISSKGEGTIKYYKLKGEALDRSVWSTGFWRGYGPVVRPTTEWMNEWMTRRHIPEETNSHLSRCENLETHKIYDKTSNCTEQVHATELIAEACSTRSLQEIFGPRHSILLPAETLLLRKVLLILSLPKLW